MAVVGVAVVRIKNAVNWEDAQRNAEENGQDGREEEQNNAWNNNFSKYIIGIGIG